jgi:hypothetical protein
MLPLSGLTLAVLLGAGLPPPVSGQLDSTCMVSALNRTAPVDGSGSWVLPNVPANLGLVRVRATCVAPDGTVRSGSSSLFTLPPNGTVSVADIGFQNPTPIPTALTLGAPVTSLSAQGQTVQLAVTATYSDGSTADVTSAAAGTDYRTSNAAIATVDANGVVAARASGNVVISAATEGALAVLRLRVVLSGSSVGDGIPDDWKIAHGLDPNDPIVAFEDPDRDGLTNLEEYQQGTDPNNPDTDGDGLSDGDEVHVYHTNPLLWDTDGDGISDGVEVKTGSDPLDRTSFNLALALSSITAAPSSLSIVFNTVYGDASRQLAATGNVIDGRTIDLLNPLYRTNFSSSDLTIASFGAVPGQVFAGHSGSATVTVSVPGHSAAVPVTVRTFSPTALAFLPIPGFANGVDVAGNYAYVAAGATGLFVVDVSSLGAPFIAGSVDTPGNANWVRVAGGLAYVADGPDGLLVIDVSNPAAPAIVGRLALPGEALNLAVRPGVVYVVMGQDGLAIADVSTPAQPRLLGVLRLPGDARGVDVSGTLAVVAAYRLGVHVIDVSNPAAPVLLGTAATRPPGRYGLDSAASDVVVRDHTAYVADGRITLGGVKVIDFHDPRNPVLIDASSDLFGLNSVALDQGFLLGADYYFVNAVPIFDVGQVPLSYTANLDFSQAPSFREDNGIGIAVRGDGAVFLVGDRDALSGKGTSSGSGLHIGLYRTSEGVAGSPPTASITAPAAGSTLTARTVATVTVEARDEVRVESVEILLGGVHLATVYKAPYQAPLTVPDGVASLSFGAVVTDFFGNSAAAQPVTVAVAPNPSPFVNLIAPPPGQALIQGGVVFIAAEASSQHVVQKVELYAGGALVATLTAPPYSTAYTVPASITQLSISAIAYDDSGASQPAGPLVLAVQPDQPPTAAIVQPVDGSQVIEQTPLAVVPGVTDGLGVAEVQFFANGVQVGDQTAGPPFGLTLQAPPAGQDLRLYVVATDTVGLTTTSPAIVVHGIPDPGTTVTGRVVDSTGAAVAGATVTVATAANSSATGATSADGSFAVPGVPTNQGLLTVTASATIGGCPLQGASAGVTAAPGGTTAVGAIALATAQTSTIVGTVQGPDGQGLAGATVKLASGDLADLATVASGPGGVFVATGFPARLWPVSAEATAPVAGSSLTGATASAVPVASGITNLGACQLQPFSLGGPDPLTTVIGRVQNADGSPAAGVEVVIDIGYDLLATATAADGSFSLAGVPTLQGSIHVAASVHQACALYNTGHPIQMSNLNPGGVTDIGLLSLQLDSGPQIFF